jgi:multidrug efflux system outer membrane protein
MRCAATSKSAPPAARVDRFLGLLTTTRSQFFPQIGYSFGASSNQVSRVGQPPLGPNADPTYNLYQGALGASWQLDLFGRVRRQSESAQAQVLREREGRRGVILSLRGGHGHSYIGLRALDRQLEIAQPPQELRRDAEVFELRLQGGVISEWRWARSSRSTSRRWRDPRRWSRASPRRRT